MFKLDRLKYFSGVIIILFFVLMISGSSYAESGLALEEVIELANENDIDLEISGLELDNARLNYEMSRARNLRTESRYQELSAELAYNQAQEENRQTRTGIYIGLINDYHNIVELNKELDIAVKEKELARKRLEDKELEVEQGLSSRIELLQQQIAFNNTEFDLISLEAELDQAERQFRTRLDLDHLPELSSRIQPVGRLDLPPRSDIVEEAIEESFQLEAARINRELSEIDLRRAEAVQTPDLELQEHRNQLKLAGLEIIQVEERVEEEALDQYHQVEQSYRQIELAVDNLEQAAEHWRITREQREAGLVSASALEEAELEHLQAELNLDLSRFAYLINYFDLQNMIGVELEVLLGEIIAVISG
ncbi:TolC family protein [Halanaerobiaceae bacterium Z-7014]|uniref:TolC family protein n=1 Tax=Halonatronomonas betaini TaxID=2778430 RepID=A0A931ASU4_9FIRM|nr:TolC family protein [Halonatronomonas betaini]MBF8437807.1 TolC family protein [Halonatronomonas betaini]